MQPKRRRRLGALGLGRAAQAAEPAMMPIVSKTRYGSDASDRRYNHNQRIMRCGKLGEPIFSASVVAPL